MRNLVPLLFTFGLSLGSCSKERTCTCMTNGGTVSSTEAFQSTSRKAVKQFESDCKAKKNESIINGVVVSTTPCEFR